jgi:tRNA(Ile)-lysidine synthase
MLEVTHAEAVRYLRQGGFPWREDRSNRDPAMLRNRVRHEILPLLARRLNPAIREALGRLAEIVRAENELLDARTRRLLKSCRIRGGDGWSVRKLKALARADRRRVLQQWLYAAGAAPDTVQRQSLDRIESLLDSSAGSKSVPLAQGLAVERRYAVLRLTAKQVDGDTAGAVPLAVPGRTAWPAAGLVAETAWTRGYRRPARETIGEYPAIGYLSRRALAGAPLLLRSIRPGDRFQPKGMAGTKKLQDLLVDQKVPRQRRAGLPVLECGGRIVWIPGYRVAEGWQVESPRAPALRLRLTRTD